MPKTQIVKRNYKKKYSKNVKRKYKKNIKKYSKIKKNTKKSLPKQIETFEQQVIGISTGIDCYIKLGIRSAFYLKEEVNKIKLLRIEVYPFDWIVTYKGVSDIIKKGRKGFDNLFKNKSLIIIEKNKDKDDNNVITDINYGISFLHDGKDLSLIKFKYIRRIERLISLIEDYNASKSNKQLVFLHKSHELKHHTEVELINNKIQNKNKLILKDDIDDSIELEKILSSKYPKLNYLIVNFLICKDCFHTKEKKTEIENKLKKSSKIIIHYVDNYETQFIEKLNCYVDKILDNKKITKQICDNDT